MVRKIKKQNKIVSKSIVKRVDVLYEQVASIIRNAQTIVARSINTAMVQAYWRIGERIVEEEQLGKKRADYGQYLITELSPKLTQEFGRGFGTSTLWDIRKFYLAYQGDQILHAARGEFKDPPGLVTPLSHNLICLSRS
jgi:hypothetical protein